MLLIYLNSIKFSCTCWH